MCVSERAAVTHISNSTIITGTYGQNDSHKAFGAALIISLYLCVFQGVCPYSCLALRR